MSLVVSIDGVLVAPEQAVISVFDRGLLYGDGCFEVLRTWDGVPVDLDAHLDRLVETAQWLSLRDVDRGAVGEAVVRAVAHAGPGEHRIRIVLTRGPGSLAARPSELGPGRTIVIIEPLPAQAREVSVAVVDWSLPRRTGHGHKTLAYLDHLVARELARAAGADEAIRLDPDGRPVEGATCNVFAVHGGTVATPLVEGGVLSGIVRARVLALCAQRGIAGGPTALSLAALRAADELFVTSSLRGVVPITRLDGEARAAGPMTAEIGRAYINDMRTRARQLAT